MSNESESNSKGRADVKRELGRLVELTAEHPAIGPTVAELAFKLGYKEIGERIVRMGTDGERPGVEYYFVTAHTARREKRWADARKAATEAARAVVEADEGALHPDDPDRLLHLIRLGYATLLFDDRDPKADPAYVQALAELLPKLEPKLGEDPFFRTLLAQTLWFEDVEQSEAEWDRAAALGKPETTWSARGTWYKDAERDLEKAEKTYKRGLEVEPKSALLLHNLAQVLIDRAEAPDVDVDAAHKLLGRADEQLRGALRADAPGLRRHIHATRDRLFDLRRSLPAPSGGRKGKGRGDRPRGQNNRGGRGGKGDRRGGGRGPGDRPAKNRPKNRPKNQEPGRDRRGDRPPRDKFLAEGKVGLGEMILAKLEEQKKQGDS